MTRQLYVLLASSTLATLVSLQLLQWRARARAKQVASRAESLVGDGPLLDVTTTNPNMRDMVIQSAMKRASKWMAFQLEKSNITGMVGQLGGRDVTKAPILKLEPDYILKPVQTKEFRGLREIAFYEAIESASHGTAAKVMHSDHSESVAPPSSWWLEYCDILAMTIAILLRDSVVAGYETALLTSWKAKERETDLLRRLSLFTASYYGVVQNIRIPDDCTQQDADDTVGHPSPRHHILLHDVTSSFCRPCVMDLKMGTQTYEPDASWEKQTKESSKYVHQMTFGFRLVGMRKYEPNHQDSDKHGYRTWDKHYGRSLTTMEAVIDAFATFFRKPIHDDTPSVDDGNVPIGNLNTKSIMSVHSLLRSLRKRFHENKSLAFYSSSILIVYDAVHDSDHANLRMIDFGHVRRQKGGDPGYGHGLQTLSSILEELLQQERQSMAHGPTSERQRLMTI
jgi:Inositol polyphosphate kinase